MQNRQHPRKKVLIVDDDRDILDFLGSFLKLEGYTVVITSRVDYLARTSYTDLPDLILLDVFLAGSSGSEMIAYLKQHEETRQIPVIMFSAHPGAEAVAQAAGANDFLFKPLDMEVLIKKIRSYF